MNNLLIQWRGWIGLGILFTSIIPCAAQGYQLNYEAMLGSTNYSRGINYRSYRGVPLSNIAGDPPGSDGRVAQGLTPSQNQFSGLLSFGAVARPGVGSRSSLLTTINYARNAINLDLIRNASGDVSMVLTRAAVGASYFSRPVAFLLGSVIAPPETDVSGALLTNAPSDYWRAEPFSTDNHAGATYYWSPHASSVFAIQSGPISVTWQKLQGTNVEPDGYSKNPDSYFVESGFYFPLKTVRYVVSGTAVKTPRKMYWTEETFSDLGRPVTIPNTRISAVNVLYSTRFPERVSSAYVAVGQSFVTGVATNRLQETRTLWYDNIGGQLRAYNLEGRVFIELLGDKVDNNSFRHLGFEIIDVCQQPYPSDITTDLGDTIAPYANGISDSTLLAEPLDLGSPFLYGQKTPSQATQDYYAVRETSNLNDALVHWTQTGSQAIQWPFVFTRYKFRWPTDVAKYSHYVRPSAPSASVAALTSVELPSQNIPAIQYQDPLDRPRAFLTENARFYTQLDTNYPAHRTLLRYLSLNQVAFERVFSWLDETLKTTSGFENSLATNLTSINYLYNNIYTTNAAARTERNTRVSEYNAYKTALAGFNQYVHQTNAAADFLSGLAAYTAQRSAHWAYVEHLRDYNANGMHWETANPLNTARTDFSATRLSNGKVLVAGGYSESLGNLRTAELYDPITGVWSRTGDMSSPRQAHSAILLANGQVLVAGGLVGDGIGNTVKSAELYDPQTERWTVTGSMRIDRSGATATLLSDGRVVLIGGRSVVESRSLHEVDIYNPNTGLWLEGASPSEAYRWHAATLLPDGQILVTGGGDTLLNDHRSRAALYSPTYDSWKILPNMPTARSFHSSTLLRNGRVLIAGGTSNGDEGLSTAVIYNPANQTWTETPRLPFRRLLHQASLLANGQVLISQGLSQGFGRDRTEDDLSAATGLYDQDLNIWTEAPPSREKRFRGLTILLSDGNLLILGGVNLQGPVGEVELGTMPPVLVEPPSESMVADYSQEVLSNPSLAYANYTNQVANYQAYTNQIPGFEAYPAQQSRYDTYLTNLRAYEDFQAAFTRFTNYNVQLAKFTDYNNNVAAYQSYLNELAAYQTYTNRLAAYTTYARQLADYNHYTNQVATYQAYTNQLPIYQAYTNQVASYQAYTNHLGAYQNYTNHLAAFQAYTNQLGAYQRYTNELAPYRIYTSELENFRVYTNQLAQYQAYTNQLSAFRVYTNQLAEYWAYTNQLGAFRAYTNQAALHQTYTNQLPLYTQYTNDLASYNLTNGTIAYWKLDEGFNSYGGMWGSVRDSSTNGLTGWFQEGAYWAYGQTNFPPHLTNAVNFTRTYWQFNWDSNTSQTTSNEVVRPQYIRSEHTSAYDKMRASFSIEAWILHRGGEAATIIDKGDYNFTLQVNHSGSSSGGLSFYNSAFGPNWYDWIHSAAPVPVGEWAHVALTWDQETHNLKFYLNGAVTDTMYYPHVQGLNLNNGPVNIGRQSPDTCGCNGFDGMMARVRLSGLARSSDQIASAFNGQDGFPPAVELPYFVAVPVPAEFPVTEVPQPTVVPYPTYAIAPAEAVIQPDEVPAPSYTQQLAAYHTYTRQTAAYLTFTNQLPAYQVFTNQLALYSQYTNDLASYKLTNGTIAYWKMDEGYGTMVRDSSTNGLDGWMMEGASWEYHQTNFPPHLANAAKFTRTYWQYNWDSNTSQTTSNEVVRPQYIRSEHTSAYDKMRASFSIEAWILHRGGESATIIDKGDYNFTLQVNHPGNPSGGLSFYNRAFEPHWADWIHSSLAVPVGEWAHVALTWDQETHNLKFYLNGAVTDTMYYPEVQGLYLNDGPVNIGRQSPDNCQCNGFDGMMAHVRLSGLARSADQIASAFNGQDGFPAGVSYPYDVEVPVPADQPLIAVLQPVEPTMPSFEVLPPAQPVVPPTVVLAEPESEVTQPLFAEEPTVAFSRPSEVIAQPQQVASPEVVPNPQPVPDPGVAVSNPASVNKPSWVAKPVKPQVPTVAVLPTLVAPAIAVSLPASVEEPPPLPGWPKGFTAPQVVRETVVVGARILAPSGELGAAGAYFAGYIRQENGNSFHPGAYQDPFTSGFDQANRGAIIPVNAIPGSNNLEVWWFRVSATNSVKNAVNDFGAVHWPSVVGRYTVVWPIGGEDIVLANNAGSGELGSLQATGTIYTQNDSTMPGYNPNEEHALMLGGKAYALRDDLNLTGTNTSAVLAGSHTTYSSAPYVLLDFVESDGRPAVRTFRVLREKPEAGELFDYVITAGGDVSRSGAGRILEAPMPLPFLSPPVDAAGRNLNVEPTGNVGDLPVGWNSSMSTTYSNYNKFTFEDRKHNFWVVRGLHDGLPALEAGTFNDSSSSFQTNMPPAFAVVGVSFTNTFHASRLPSSLVIQEAGSTPLPRGLRLEGTELRGIPTEAGDFSLQFTVTDNGDGASVQVTLSLKVFAEKFGYVHAQGPLRLRRPTASGASVLHVGRPPFLADIARSTNSFAMRFYYKTQEGFAWPGFERPPTNGSIVPYLRPIDGNGAFVGAADQSSTESLGIVYRPVWPGNPPRLEFGETLMSPKHGLPAVREQTSVQILYQQAISKSITAPQPAVTLHDPTREKSFVFVANGLAKIPSGVRTEYYQGKTYFPNLPPHLAERVFFDSNRGPLGHLVVKGEFKDEVLGEDYLMLNVLRGTDLERVKALCPNQPVGDKLLWDSAVEQLTTAVHTYFENPQVPGTFITSDDSTFRRVVGVGGLAEISHSDTAVDSYALSASGPGRGYVTMIVGDGRAFTPDGDPVTVYVLKVEGSLYPGELKIVPSANPLSELISFQHSADLAGRFDEYEYEWKINPPVDGAPPRADARMSRYQPLTSGLNLPQYTLGGSGVQALVDNYIVLRYRPRNVAHPLYQPGLAAIGTNWSRWTEPQLAEGWIKRVLAGINPFGQRVTDLFGHGVNTDANILTSAGKRWEGDVALNLANVNNSGLIEIYETVLRRGRSLSIDAGINFGPANDALLLAAGYLNDLYTMVGNEAYADSSNPTIGIGTKDRTYGDIATALFSFKGQLPTLLDEELALLRGRDDVLQPGVQTSPVYNRLVWNYTRGIDSGEVIYALNYNVLDQNTDGKVDAADAAKLFPQGHGDAYGHYLTATKGYYSLLLNNSFDWVPRTEAVTVLGKPVAVDYLDERKFASSAAAVARTGRQIFDLTWRQNYTLGQERGWTQFSETRVSQRTVLNGTATNRIVRHWGADQWASRTMQGSFLNWVVGNAILPEVDPDPSHEGIQKIDRSTVPELVELPTTAADLQAALDNAEGGLTPLGLPEGSLAFDIKPTLFTTVGFAEPKTHFEQVFDRAKGVLNNAVASFDDAKDVTRLMRSEQDSVSELQAKVAQQELAYKNSLIELYGTPYSDDIGPGKTYLQGYDGPDLIHYTYTDQVERIAGNQLELGTNYMLSVDIQNLPSTWMNVVNTTLSGFVTTPSEDQKVSVYIDSKAAFAKPSTWSGRRASPGAIQQSISEYTAARNRVFASLQDAQGAKDHLVKSVLMFNTQKDILGLIKRNDHEAADREQDINSKSATMASQEAWLQASTDVADTLVGAIAEGIPQSLIVGLAGGGDVLSGARAAVYFGLVASKTALLLGGAGAVQAGNNQIVEYQEQLRDLVKANANLQLDLETKNAVFMLEEELDAYQANLWSINERLRELDDADRAYRSLVAQGDRLQNEREVYRQRAAAIVQGFRTRDAAFRIFRNEKLERYKTLFDLAARYAYLTANAYDYETGLLNTDKGRAFVNRIVSSRALGMVKDGEPQYAGSNTGDPGLSSALAEMKADWDVLRGRLGFNNPDTYGTTVSLRTENLRILPGTEGKANWQDVLSGSQRANLLDDPDIRRHCLQIDLGNGLPVPGIVLSFSTTVDAGKNLFGHPLAAGDQGFDVSSFATKIFAMGVVLEGYLGMNDPEINGTAIDGTGGISPTEPSSLDPRALSGTPYVYLIPAGVDSMRSPPLGDQSKIRSWNVNDVAIPLPFNIGGSDFSTKKLYQSADSLAEPLFGVRKHQAFRPVSNAAHFNLSGEGNAGAIQISPFSNRRLIGRSVWNSQWKIVIPGRTLLNDPKEGLKRFIDSVTDVKLHFVTYSYSGN